MALKIIERSLIYLAKKLNIDLLSHAHIQLGIAGYNDFDHTGEKKVLQLLAKKNLQIQTIFDVGANDGTYSLLLEEIFPSAAIYAFEPVPATFDTAQKVLSNSKNVHLFKLGLYREDCLIDIYNDSTNPNSQISTVFGDGLKEFYAVNELKQTSIEVKKTDTICRENHIDNIDFMKIDVEGAELSVLEGASNMIASKGIRMIQFEFNDFNISSRTFIKDFYKLLNGYRFFRISSQGLINMHAYTTNHEIFKYQNIIAIHPGVKGFETNENIFF